MFEPDNGRSHISVLRIVPRGQVYREQEMIVIKPQIIRDDAGQPAFAVLPWREFERLAGAGGAEAALTDEELYDLAKASDEESFPVEVVKALVDGEHPIAVFCRHRGMRQYQVAEHVGIKVDDLYQIVKGTQTGSTETMSAIARVLNVDLDDLVPHET